VETSLGGGSPPSPNPGVTGSFWCRSPYSSVQSSSPYCLYNSCDFRSCRLLLLLYKRSLRTRQKRPFHIPSLQSTGTAPSTPLAFIPEVVYLVSKGKAMGVFVVIVVGWGCLGCGCACDYFSASDLGSSLGLGWFWVCLGLWVWFWVGPSYFKLNPIFLMWDLVCIMLSPIRLIWRLFFRDVSGEDPADAMVDFHSVEGAEIHCAISKRLYSATFKAVENFPVFIELFDQWVHTPSLRPLSVSDWHEVLPLVQPYLLSASLSNGLGLLPVARLLLCSDSDVFPSEREAIIASLGKGSGNTTESPSIEQMYIHLLGSPECDWSLAGQVVRELDADRGTTIELRWILNWITFRYLIQSEEFPNNDGLSWVSTIRNIIPFLRSTAVYIIQNRLVNDDDKLFNSLLLITRAVADASKEAGWTPSYSEIDKIT
jgi:hypothetical protein